MSENEWKICAINAAARAVGKSYGQYVALHTKAELTEAIAGWRPPPKERKRKE